MRRNIAVLLFLGALLFLVGAALVRTIDHDEGQYVGAVAMMRHGLPFRDFMYLQTPLQPLLLAPLAWLGGGLFLSLRIVNAAASAGVVALVYLGARAGGGGQRQAAAAAALMLCCEPLIFAGAVARNDALPALFAAAGTWLLLKSLSAPRDWLPFLLAGLAFGAAISTKISYAFPAAAAGLVILACHRQIGIARIAAFAGGGVAGLLPSLAMFLAAPESWLFGVLEYGFTAPQQWWHSAGEAARLDSEAQFTRFLRFLVQGPALVALAFVALAGFRRWGDRRALLLDALIGAGLIAAILPEPMFRQYLLPILPPLFMRLGSMPGALHRRSRWTALFMASAMYGVWHTGSQAVAAASAGSPVVAATRDALWIGDQVRGAGVKGEVVGLSPERLVDSALPIDKRFVTGPFMFRTRQLLSSGEEKLMNVLTRESFARAFLGSPPAAIVTGGERKTSRSAPGGLDAPLDHWARANGYRPALSPSGTLTLYLRPAA